MPELLVGVTFSAAALEVVRFAAPQDKVQPLIYSGRTLLPQEGGDALLFPCCGATTKARELGLPPIRHGARFTPWYQPVLPVGTFLAVQR